MKRTVLPADFIRSEDLSKIVQYSAAQHHPNWKVLLLHVGVGVVAGISPITYVKPSYADIPPYGLPDHSSIRVMQVVSTWAATTALLYLACGDFIMVRMQNSVPPELEGIVEGLSKAQIRRQDWAIGLISAASAIPLTTPLVKFPLISTGNPNIDIPGNVGLVGVILISNSIAHLRPLQLIISDPWYGAPFTAIKFVKRKWQERRMTKWNKFAKEQLAQKAQNSMQLKNSLLQVLQSNSEKMIDECLVFKKKTLGYQVQLTDYFRHVSQLTDDAFIFGIVEAQLRNPTASATNMLWKQKISDIFLNVPAQVAGLLALAESLGYLADSGFEFDKLTGSTVAGWLLAAVPIYAFGVLIHNAARAQTRDVQDFLVNFMRGSATLSWPIKYCARTFFGVLLAPSLAILLLNSSAANTMIRSDFGEYCSDTFIDKYISISRWGYVWLATLLVVNTEKYLFSKWAKYFGSEEANQMAAFAERVQDTAMRLSQWKPDRFEGWLAEQTPEFRQQALGITEQAYQELAETLDTEISINSQRFSAPPPLRHESTYGWICGFFGRKAVREDSFTGYRLLDEKRTNNSRHLQSSPVQSSSWWDRLCCWKKGYAKMTEPENPPVLVLEV